MSIGYLLGVEKINVFQVNTGYHGEGGGSPAIHWHLWICKVSIKYTNEQKNCTWQSRMHTFSIASAHLSRKMRAVRILGSGRHRRVISGGLIGIYDRRFSGVFGNGMVAGEQQR